MKNNKMWLNILDWSLPILAFLVAVLAFAVIFILYIAAGALSMGILLIYWGDEISAIGKYFFIIAPAAGILTAIIQLYLYFFHSTTLARMIFKRSY